LAIEKQTWCSAGTAPSNVTPLALATVLPTRCSTKIFFEGGFQIGGAADEVGLAPFADPAFEDGFLKHRPGAFDEGLDVLLAGVRAEHFRGRIPGELQQLRAVEHASDFHGLSSPREIAGRRAFITQKVAAKRTLTPLTEDYTRSSVTGASSRGLGQNPLPGGDCDEVQG
jgi:hypothetical protein